VGNEEPRLSGDGASGTELKLRPYTVHRFAPWTV